MAKYLLTKTKIQKGIQEAKKTGKQIQLSDGAGLFLLLSPKHLGHGSWAYIQTTGKNRKRTKLGDFCIDSDLGFLTIEQARIEVAKFIGDESLLGKVINSSSPKVSFEQV